VEFRLRASLQSEVELLAVRDNLLNDRLHLVHLNRIDDKVFSLVSILFLCLLKTAGCLLDTVVEDVWETEQYGSVDVA
jgi:hypothetical protein